MVVSSYPSVGSGNDEFRFAAYKVFLLQRMTAEELTSYVTFHGDGFTDRVLTGARRGPGQSRTGNRRIVLLLGEAGQQVRGTLGFLGPGHTPASLGFNTPDGSAIGALGCPLEVPERIRIEVILSFALRANEQHSWSPSNTFLFFESLEIRGRQPANLAQDAFVVGAHRLPRPLQARRCSRHLVSRRLVQQFTVGRVIQPAKRAALVPVRVVGDLFRVPHRLIQDVIGVHHRRYLLLRLIRGPLFQSGINLHLALGLDADISLGVLGGQRAFTYGLAQAREVLVLISADHDVTLFQFLRILGIGVGGLAALDDAVDAQLGIPVAPALAGDAEFAVEGQGILELAGDAVHLRVLGKGALAGDVIAPVQRGQDLRGAHHAAPVVGQPDGVLGRRAAEVFLFAGHAEVAALRLSENVVRRADSSRSPAAKTTEPAVDEPGIDLLQLTVSDAPAVEGSGAVVLHEHVRFGGQFLDQRLSFRLVEVDGDEILVRIRPYKAQPRAALRDPHGKWIEEGLVKRSGVAHRLAAPGGLDLDDFGSQFGHVGSAAGTQNVLGTRQHPVSLQHFGFGELLLGIEAFPAELLE